MATALLPIPRFGYIDHVEIVRRGVTAMGIPGAEPATERGSTAVRGAARSGVIKLTKCG
jgi:hypothetical protein